MQHTYVLREGMGHWFSLAREGRKISPIRWEFRLLVSLIGDADGDATYLWSVWRHGSLIFPCQRRPKKFRLSGESFVCWSVSFVRPGCWRRCNIPMICVKAWVIDFPLPQKAEKVPPIRWEFRLFCSLIQYGMLTAMQHTYDLCEGMGHWFSLAGEGRIVELPHLRGLRQRPKKRKKIENDRTGPSYAVINHVPAWLMTPSTINSL